MKEKKERSVENKHSVCVCVCVFTNKINRILSYGISLVTFCLGPIKQYYKINKAFFIFVVFFHLVTQFMKADALPAEHTPRLHTQFSV